ELVAKVYNGRNEVESRPVRAIVNVRQPAGQPDLYVVAAGISEYRDYALNQGVRFAASDAETLAARLKQQGQGLFGNVTTVTLTNANATRAKIESTVAGIAAKTKPSDVSSCTWPGTGWRSTAIIISSRGRFATPVQMR